jgi:hypothetical protein
MTSRSVHRIIGVIMILPMIGWAVTGFIFFVKPGYGGAYEMLAVKTYALDGAPSLNLSPAAQAERRSWLEYRVFKTILGEHLLVRTATGWQQLNPSTLEPEPEPQVDAVADLVSDALTVNPQRYGRISHVNKNVVITTTGVEVTLDWKRMSLQQKGRDTDRIDRLYKIHYLQWTGVKRIDRVLGLVGLSLVLALTVLGVRLAFRRR